MKKTIKNIIFAMMLLEIPTLACAQDKDKKLVFENTIRETVAFAKQRETNVLVIDNVNGSIEVESYKGNEIIMEIKQELSAKTEAKLEKAKQETQIKFQQSGDSIIAYFPLQRRSDCCDDAKGWTQNRWNTGDEYNYLFDFKVKVPLNTNLYLRTVNKGDIKVSNIEGQICVANVNGSLTLDKITGTTQASTVNGKIDITYTANPPKDSDYKTINGTITVNYKENLSADLTFKSMHGEFYTDFQVTEYLNSVVEKNEKESAKGKRYMVSARPAVRIGKGGTTHHFETLNGNIFIKKVK
jgi:DUF4097 and DUF4098 domain-containing protein YvlB